jgi:anti-sigma-K factor RskA
MSADHDELKSLAGAYVLGALEHDERRTFEAHLTSCVECEAEVRSLRPVVVGLARAVPERNPSAALRDRVLTSITGSSATALPRPGAEIRRGPRAKAVWTDARVWLPLAAMLVIVIGIGAYAARLQGRVADLEARLDSAMQQAVSADRAMADARRVALEAQSAMAVLAAPDLARIDLAGQTAAPQARARALWSRARGMVFTVSDLPAPPAGRVYQVWVVTSRAPISAGLLTPDANGRSAVVFATPPDIPAPVAVAVTLEPAGGVPAPTGEKYLVGMVKA